MPLHSLHPFWQAQGNSEEKRVEKQSHCPLATLRYRYCYLHLQEEKTEVQRNRVTMPQVTELVRGEATSFSKCSRYNSKIQH